jgi:[CysO sulfur-carrier protein]-S-L-cysteine hydrolase
MSDSAAGSPKNWSQFALRSVVAEDMDVSALFLSTKLRDTIVQHLQRCLPEEGVGVLATRGTSSSRTAVRFYPGRNIDSSPRRYTMDPVDVLAALTDMKRERTRLGAIVHSHPHTPPVPSRTDLVEAACPGALSLIVGFSPVVELSAWRIVLDGNGVAVRVDEIPVVCGYTGEPAGIGFLQRAGHTIHRRTPRHPVKGTP